MMPDAAVRERSIARGLARCPPYLRCRLIPKRTSGHNSTARTAEVIGFQRIEMLEVMVSTCHDHTDDDVDDEQQGPQPATHARALPLVARSREPSGGKSTAGEARPGRANLVSGYRGIGPRGEEPPPRRQPPKEPDYPYAASPFAR
jgi:hypothetical protein